MTKFKLVFLGVALLLASLACVVTIPVPGGVKQPTMTPFDTPSLTSTSTSTSEPSVTPVPPPTRRAVMTESVFAFPTITPLPPIPSMTLPNLEETLISGTFTPTSTIDRAKIKSPTPERLKCRVELVKPEIGEDFKPGVDFEVAWRITNEGGKIWIESEFYFDYVSGEQMHNPGYGPRYVTYAVFPSDRFRLNVRMNAPKAPGRYSATWGLWHVDSKEPFCTFYVVIDVKK